MAKGLAWTCHICGVERPDAAISVCTTTWRSPDGVVASQNVRYCNDEASCRKAAAAANWFGPKWTPVQGSA